MRSINGVMCHFRVIHFWGQRPYTCVTARYKYWSVVMTKLYGKALGLLQKLGATVDPSIAWNAIPFSFLIDWVYPVGEFLHRHNIPLVDINVTIESFGFGAGATMSRIVYLFPNGMNMPIRHESYSLYQRTRIPIEDVELKHLEFQGLTLRKALNGSALVWSMLIRGGKRGR